MTSLNNQPRLAVYGQVLNKFVWDELVLRKEDNSLKETYMYKDSIYSH